jgi:hypothetical protein
LVVDTVNLVPDFVDAKAVFRFFYWFHFSNISLIPKCKYYKKTKNSADLKPELRFWCEIKTTEVRVGAKLAKIPAVLIILS